MPSATVLIIPSFIPFNTIIPIATLLVAMPTPLITSWQSHFFQFFVSSVCFLLFFLNRHLFALIWTNLFQTVDVPTVVTANTPGCQWYHKHPLTLSLQYSLSIYAACSWTRGTSGFHLYSSFVLPACAKGTHCPLWITLWLARSFIA